MKTTNLMKQPASIPSMKHALLLAVASLVFVMATQAQPGPPAPPAPPREALQTVNTYQGTVAKMAMNDEYVYDGFYLLRGSDSLLVKFPPHLGKQVAGLAKPGATVSVNGVLSVAPLGEKEIRLVSLTANGNVVADTGVPPADNPPADTYFSGNGKITAVQTNREGEIVGVIVDPKIILRIPPHIARQLGSAMRVGSTVSFTGMKKAVNNGEATAGDYAVVHGKTITVNGQQYFIE